MGRCNGKENQDQVNTTEDNDTLHHDCDNNCGATTTKTTTPSGLRACCSIEPYHALERAYHALE